MQRARPAGRRAPGRRDPRALNSVTARIVADDTDMNLTLQYFTMYLSFFVSIIVNLLINTEILCCVIPILEAAWMTVMVTVTGGHPSRLSPQCRLGALGSGKEPHRELHARSS